MEMNFWFQFSGLFSFVLGRERERNLALGVLLVVETVVEKLVFPLTRLGEGRKVWAPWDCLWVWRVAAPAERGGCSQGRGCSWGRASTPSAAQDCSCVWRPGPSLPLAPYDPRAPGGWSLGRTQ